MQVLLAASVLPYRAPMIYDPVMPLAALLTLLLMPATSEASPASPTPRVYYADPSGADTKDPSVCRFNGKYFLYYSVAPHAEIAGWSVGIATSTNLLDWTFVTRLTPTTEFEKKGFCAPGVRVIDGKVHLFYQSYGNGNHDAILHAISDDGVHFERDATSPVFAPTGDWTNGRAIDAEVVPVGDRMLMYWATRDRTTSGIQMVGISTAPRTGPFGKANWTQLTTDLSSIFRPTVPNALDASTLDCAWEQKCIEGPTLLGHGGKYYLFYGGLSTTRRSRSAWR